MKRNLKNIIKLLKAMIKEDEIMAEFCRKDLDRISAHLFFSEKIAYEEFLELLENQEKFNKKCVKFGIVEEE